MTTFNLTYHTLRWGNSTSLLLGKTDTGWHIQHIAINGDTAPDGKPILRSNLHQDNVQFPHGIDGFLQFVWEKLHHEEVDAERAQDMLDELGQWISSCETSQPRWKEWNC